LCNSINIIQTKFFLHTNKSFTIKPYIYLSIFIASIMSIRWRIMFSNFLHTVWGKDLAIAFSKMAMYPHDILSVCYMPHRSIVKVSAKIPMMVAKLSESKQMFGNASVLLWYNRLSLLQTLSLSVGIYLQYPHTQNGAFDCSLLPLVTLDHAIAAPANLFKNNCLDLKPSFAILTRINYLLSN
jgi:hypothetical protein